MSTIKTGTTLTTAYQVEGDTTGAFVVQTGSVPTTAMTINSSQNVGIGTSSPATTLNVVSANTAGTDNLGNVYIRTTDALAADVGGKLTLGGYYNGSSTYAFGGIAGRKENATSNNVAGYLQFLTTTSGGALTERMRIDSSGNVGIGVTPSAWRSIIKAFQLGSSSALWGFTDRNLTVFSNNVYQNSAGTDVYQNNGYAQRYSQDTTGNHVWLNSASGTAGNAITFTEAMRIDSSGNLILTAAGNINLNTLNTYSTSGNGYQKLPSGIIIQWGKTASIGGTSVAVTFPVAFPTSCANVSVTQNYARSDGKYSANTGTPTTTGVTLYNTDGLACPLYWMAIGY